MPAAHRLYVRREAGQADAHRVQGQVGRAEGGPFRLEAAPVVRGTSKGEAGLDAEGAGVAAGVADVAPEALDLGLPALRWMAEGKPAVGDPGGAPEDALVPAAQPDRNRPLDRPRVQAGPVEGVPATRKLDERLRP